MKSVPLDRGQKCWDIPMGVTICVPMKECEKVGMYQEVSLVAGKSKGSKKVGISPEMSPLVCQRRVGEK